MKLLLDTHLLLWAAQGVEHVPLDARRLMSAFENELFFSVASLWEIVIKRGLGRDDFKVDPRVLRRSLLDNGYSELSIHSEHAVAVDSLPLIHKDPFDRILVAQAIVEGISLLTADARLAEYPGPIQCV
ncbi:type II toxin-antitoxin system VapC family toxin [Dyella sp. M7H15-1]|uniref:type II toxin-antitoxin system VapC family toxin n=1 Tax=Dyella sp. M7H15-1 TaxID=2501295 RepID=UPI00100508E5|nr:type II toxin-antitoxin system VapC family toxin [Dyella sp. M7H15-1]QAU23456.1 type II toxin-antitoxin system VapC family toxin [Dyella sp. M7H15-1]